MPSPGPCEEADAESDPPRRGRMPSPALRPRWPDGAAAVPPATASALLVQRQVRCSLREAVAASCTSSAESSSPMTP